MSYTLILLRHGQSQWNLENRFTGWTDVELSEAGKEEARRAGRAILKSGLKPQYFFTSYLRRAIHTLQLAAAEMDRDWVPICKDWHLNERHYGALQGLNKSDTALKYGDEQVAQWRRSYDVKPPALAASDPRSAANEEKYASLSAEELPDGESLKTTIMRVRSCWEEKIEPQLRLRGCVLVSAHGNSLRALAMLLKKIPEQEISRLEIATGSPWVFNLDERMSVTDDYYLPNPEAE